MELSELPREEPPWESRGLGERLHGIQETRVCEPAHAH